MTSRPYGGGFQTLEWNHENRLSEVSRPGTSTSEYLYDPDGQRVKKTQGNKVSYYFNKYYELEINGGVRGSSVVPFEDPDNPAPVPPIEPPLPEAYNPPVAEDINLQQAAYLPFMVNASVGEGEVRAAQLTQPMASSTITPVCTGASFGGQRIAPFNSARGKQGAATADSYKNQKGAGK